MIPFLYGRPDETALYERIRACLLARCPEVTEKISRTQLAFVREVQFAWLSLPRRKADAGGLMVSFALPTRCELPRVLYAAEVTPGKFMHHTIVHDPEEIDDELMNLLLSAWALCGVRRR